MIETVRFIKNQLDAMSFDIVINNYTVDDTQTTLNVCKTLHARKDSIITINGQGYTVLSFVNNTSITIEGTPSNPTTGTLNKPNYFHGTAMAVNAVLPNLAKELKFPLLYCYEIIPEKHDNRPDSSIDRESDLRLYYLDNANFQDWTTDEHYDYVIDPMKNFQQHMMDKFNACPKIAEFDDYDTINHVKFGVWTDRKGHTSKIFNEHLSGVELLMTMPIKKDLCNQFETCN